MTDTTPANTTEAPAVAGRLDQPVRPRAWLYHDGPTPEQMPHEFCGTRVLAWDRQPHYRNETPLYALPPELVEYLLRHLQQERALLDGFLRLGNEKSRAKRLDAWIACIAGPNVGDERPARSDGGNADTP